MKLEIRVNRDLTLCLYDASTGKTLKSIPTSGADPEKRRAAEEKFSRTKAHVRGIVKNQREKIQQDYFLDRSVPFPEWKGTYLDDPVLSRVAALVVWKHVEKGKARLFTLSENCLIDSDGKPFEPSGGSVKTAGAFEMTPSESQAWQAYFVKNELKQLYEQVWEPVLPWNAVTLPSRYEGAVLSAKERSRVKSRLKAAGINMKSDQMEGTYNHRTRKYTFGDHNTVTVGNCLRIAYTIAEKTGDWTFGRASPIPGCGTREMNKALLELDRGVIRHSIAMDREAILLTIGLEAYTATQIIEFLNVAISSKSPKCTALLLDYKNAHFTEYSQTDEFTLE